MSDSSVVIPFEGGLDMVTPVQETAPGTLVDCLNYEVGPIKGYKRIDGYERFDGGLGGGITNIYRVAVEIDDPDFFVTQGDFLLLGNKVVGRVSSMEFEYLYYIPTEPGNRLQPWETEDVFIKGIYSGDITPIYVLSNTEDYRDVAPSTEAFYQKLYSAQYFFRDRVLPAPGNLAGVYHGRTTAFAVVDMIVLNITSESYPLEAGHYLRMGTSSYKVMSIVPGEGAHIAVVRTGLPAVPNLQVVRRQTAFTGVGSALSILQFTSLAPQYFGRYAQPYVVDEGFTPIDTSVVVAFTNGAESFGETVRLSDGFVWAEYKVLGYSINSGGFDTEDASGFLYLADTGSSSENFNGVWPGAAPDLANSDMEVLANVDYRFNPSWVGTRGLKGYSSEDAQTFYQWGTYNFKATRRHEMVFATTGRGRAGYITRMPNGTYFYGTIVTNADANTVLGVEDDIPKYLAFHAGQRLALGFADGSLRLSAVANPLNFSGFEGAVEVGTGDNITGLLEGAGDSTIVFGSRTIRRLVGEGSSLALKTVRSEAGAMDYTACVVAGTPVYVNQNGICTLEQTSSYGDFKNSAISGAIDPFLTPKIVQELGTIEIGGALCAFPVRSKNQYRLFLGNGQVVSMSVTAAGPQAMLSNYAEFEGELYVPIAYSSSVDDEGHEYVFTVWDREKALQQGIGGLKAYADVIYRMDHGWGFDGSTFRHYIDLTYLFNQNPNFLTVDRAILYGMGYGMATLRLRSSGLEDNFYSGFDQRVQDISMPRNEEILYRQLGRVLGNVDTANWGRAIQLRFENIKNAGGGFTEPPHILQSVRLFVQTDGITE